MFNKTVTYRLIRNLPNIITLARVACVPLIVWLIIEGFLLQAFWLFVAAGVSDALDGFIAKRFDLETELGKYLDPLADKALLVSIYLSLGYEGYIASWLVILVVFRDFAIVSGALLLETITHSLTMRPLMVSKVNTLMQIVLATMVLANAGFDLVIDSTIDILMIVTAFTTVVSGFAYAGTCIRRGNPLEGTNEQE